jgi:hypothetical protein
MRAVLLALVLSGVAGAAVAQTKPATTPGPGSASAKTQLQALHYGNIHDLRRGPDGQWTGKATQNGVEKQVTISPKGVVTAR